MKTIISIPTPNIEIPSSTIDTAVHEMKNTT